MASFEVLQPMEGIQKTTTDDKFVELSRKAFQQLSVAGAPRAPKAMLNEPRANHDQRHYAKPRPRLFRRPPLPRDWNLDNRFLFQHQQLYDRSGVFASNWAHQGGNNMADVDSRGDHYRGQGGYGGGRKRRFREDDQFYDRPRPQQRRRFEEPLFVRVRKQILGIGENSVKTPEEEIQSISRTIIHNNEDEHFNRIITDLIPQIVVEQPFKVPHCAAIALHVNAQRPEFTKEIINKVGPKIQAHLENGEWRSFKLLLRFLACVQSLFEGDGVFSVLEELFNRAVDLQTASQEDVLGLELVKIIMLTIPYVLASPAEGSQQKAAELLERTELIASAEHTIENVVVPYLNAGQDGVPACPSFISLLQKQLQAEAANDWPLTMIPRLFKPDATEGEAMNGDQSSQPQKHDFPSITVPAVVNTGSRPLFPEIFFSLYADQDVETVPPTTKLAASLIRDACSDTVNILDFNRAVSARYLIEMDGYWAPGTFAERATPFDKIKDFPAGQSSWKPEDLAVDAIFSQMLQLPFPEHKLVYYHSMITEACKIAPSAIAPSLGRAIRFLYKNLPALDLELFYRVVDWFSHHLSNFDFRWKWTEWVGDVDNPSLEPKKAFILGVLDKEVRLSFARRIRETLPEAYQPLIPTSKDNDIPEYKFKHETTPYSAEGKQILSLLKKKAPDEEFEGPINAINESEAGRSSDNPVLASTDAYVTSICHIGSKSLSHVLSYIERSVNRLMALGGSVEDESVRIQIISSVVAHWQTVQPGVAVNIVDKLLNYKVITPSSVISWALYPPRIDSGRLLSQSWVYEMVSRTMTKITSHVRDIVAHRNQPNLPAEQADKLEEMLTIQRESMRALFGTIDDALRGVAEGSNDGLQMEQDFTGNEEELAQIRMWGMKWRRDFARRVAVVESIVGEAATRFPPPADPNAVDESMDGVDGEAVNGDADGVALAVEAAVQQTNGEVGAEAADGDEEIL